MMMWQHIIMEINMFINLLFKNVILHVFFGEIPEYASPGDRKSLGVPSAYQNNALAFGDITHQGFLSPRGK